MSFLELGLSADLVRAVTEYGYTVPTPIQSKAIPAVLSGKDLLAGAQTGTGKTAGFVLPMLQRLAQASAAANGAARPVTRGAVRALILTPTRELAAQVEQSVKTYGKYTKFKSLAIFGGVGINPQITSLRAGIDILVATPGRLLDHVQQRTVDLSKVEILVLDEADRMLDMGFIHDIKRVLKLVPANRQNLLFSATFSDEIKQLADSLLDSPLMIEVARRNAPTELVEQRVYLVEKGSKRALLSHLIKEGNWFQVLVFTRTKHGADRLAEQLGKDGITSLAIHGNKSQGARTRALAQFKDATLQVLVATDIAARGLDIVDLPHVVNFELPNVPEDYVHRIGRTGRAGAEGEATSLVCVDELRLLADIERVLKRALPKQTLADFPYDPNARPEPIQPPRRGGGGGGQQRHGAQPGRSSPGGRSYGPSAGRPGSRAPARAGGGASGSRGTGR